ncbi:MAG: Asp-tRNA(Asn)/Glu-tRNA(Gln) amidotransferase subunit GatA [Endomicrobiales bacterium]|jgi:aspartyl-tRNA(Asn)/glutamyl-tRNA(Gln) amidotransferase subunit A
MNDIIGLSAIDLVDNIRARKISSTEVTAAFLAHTASCEPKIKAFVTRLEIEAMAQAAVVDAKLRSGETVGMLAGVPVAVKDNIMVTGARTTCSSKIMEKYVAPYDAHVIARLRAADAVFVGKTNLDEFAMGSSTENSAFGVTRNPWNTDFIPGGSSGGSAAAVAARMAPLAIGSDTGGSIRQPAALCGVVGLKPTYGRVSRYGLVAFASSLDQVGPFAGSVEDAALLLSAIAGYDEGDSTSVDKPVPDYSASLKKDIKGLKVGLPKEYFIDGVSPEVDAAVKNAIAVFKDLGAEIREITLPNTAHAVAVYYILAPSEASSNLARYDGVKYGFRGACSTLLEEYENTRGDGFGAEVKRRIMLGTYALSSGYYDAYYAKAQKVRTLIKQDFDRAFAGVDLIVTPTTPTPAFKIGAKSADPLQMYLSDIFTISCNLAGIPGISIPCGFSADGLPIGMQLLAAPFAEETMLRAGHQYQQHTSWHTKRPPVV